MATFEEEIQRLGEFAQYAELEQTHLRQANDGSGTMCVPLHRVKMAQVRQILALGYVIRGGALWRDFDGVDQSKLADMDTFEAEQLKLYDLAMNDEIENPRCNGPMARLETEQGQWLPPAADRLVGTAQPYEAPSVRRHPGRPRLHNDPREWVRIQLPLDLITRMDAATPNRTAFIGRAVRAALDAQAQRDNCE